MHRLPTIKQLQHLTALAEARHFGRAAQRAGVTQSTLSASIAELEETLGAAVADRSGRQITLTLLGQQVAEQGQKILMELQELTEIVRATSAPLESSLRLGVIPTISPYLLPRLLPGLRSRYPRLKLYLQEDLTEKLLERLEQGDLDLLLLALPCRRSQTETRSLMHDPFLVALPKDHALARQKKISTDQLKKEKLLVLQDGHCLREHALAACGLRDNGVAEAYAATSLPTLVQMAANGLGIALVPDMAVRAGLMEGTHLVTVPVEGHAHRDIALMWRKGSVRAGEFQLMADQFERLLGRRRKKA